MSDEKTTEVVTLEVVLLKTSVFVRKHLDEDRVLFFAERYEAGAEVPPITVYRGGSMEIKDGRHRKAALQLMEEKYAQCVLVSRSDDSSLEIVEAMACNLGGPLPPKRSDIVFVIRQLLEANETQKRIRYLLKDYFKPSQISNYIRDACAAIVATKLQKAKLAVAHGDYTVSSAAEAHGVDVDKLKTAISGKKTKKRPVISDVRISITNRNRGNSNQTVTALRAVFAMYEDGEVDEQSVLDLLLHIKKAHQDAAKRLDGWLERFEALKGSVRARI